MTVPPVSRSTLRGLAGGPMPPMLGLQGLRWEGGYAQVLDLGPNDPGPVVASFTLVTGEAPRIGAPAELDARYYPQDPLESDLSGSARSACQDRSGITRRG